MALIVPRHAIAMDAKDGDQASQMARMLRSPDPGVRARALEELGRAGEMGAELYGNHEKAYSMIDDVSTQVQVAAITALGSMGIYGATYMDYFAQKLKFQTITREVRKACVRALGAFGPLASGEADVLERCLDDKDVDLVGLACAALGAVGAHHAREAIAAKLKSDEVEIIVGACRGLGCLGTVEDDLVDPLNHKQAKVRAAATSALAWDSAAVEHHLPKVISLVADSSSNVRASAVNMISALGAKAAEHVGVLGNFLSHKDPGVRAAAAAALGGIGEASSSELPRLEKLLADVEEDKSTHVMTIAGLQPKVAPVFRKPACAAASAMAAIGKSAQKFAPKLADGLDSFDEEIRIQCVCALSGLGDAGAKYEDRVVSLLEDSAPMVKAAACYSLGSMAEATKLPSSGIAGQVAELAVDSHPAVRGMAVASLGKMGEEGAAHIDVIAGCIEDRVGSVRMNAVRALVGVGEVGEMFAGDVCRLMYDRESRVRLAAIETMPKFGQRGAAFSSEIAALLDDPSADIRLASVKCLGGMTGLEALQFQTTIASIADTDESEQVRNAAVTAAAALRSIEDGGSE